MGEMEDLKEELSKYCKDKLILYEVDGDDLVKMSKQSIGFGGGEYKDFLKIAEKLCIKVIYYSEAFGETKEDKIAAIDLGFIYDGVLHSFSASAPWYEKELERANGIDLGGEIKDAKKLLGKPAKDIAVSMIDFIDKERSELGEEMSENLLNNLKSQFWTEYDIDAWSLEPKLKIKTEKTEYIVDRHFLDIIHKAEDNQIDSLAVECVEWSTKQGISGKTYLKKSTIKVFLDEKGIQMSSLGLDKLYNKVLMKMRG